MAVWHTLTTHTAAFPISCSSPDCFYSNLSLLVGSALSLNINGSNWRWLHPSYCLKLTGPLSLLQYPRMELKKFRRGKVVYPAPPGAPARCRQGQCKRLKHKCPALLERGLAVVKKLASTLLDHVQIDKLWSLDERL